MSGVDRAIEIKRRAKRHRQEDFDRVWARMDTVERMAAIESAMAFGWIHQTDHTERPSR